MYEINQSRTPLVYDIQELFRWLIDVSAIQVLEEKKIKKDDFMITENYHTRLGEDAALFTRYVASATASYLQQNALKNSFLRSASTLN